MEKKSRKLEIEDLEKVNGGFHVFNNEKCPLYGEHKWKQIENGMEKCDCGAYRSQVISIT